jgi:cytochrome c-type biogenesis protein CcsB
MFTAALLVAYARFVVPAAMQATRPLLPALDSVWLPLHVGTTALAYGALALAGAAGLAWLLGEHLLSEAEGLRRTDTEWLLDRAIAAGFPLLTLSMILGMIWAQVAWGRYWGWNLKEVWTLITWLVYALYWHVRRWPRWQGRRLACLALIGLASVLLTFLGVGWLARTVGLESLHLF